tara:strand:+ start:3708 stop:4907 length:1200 start_codon:yes stop_codon:yes gene_type:complete
MKINSITLFAALAAVIMLASCTREGCTDPAATNYADNADSDDGTCEYDVDAPATYVFTDASGNSTVSYNGQRQRLNMLSEMTSYLKSANNPGTALDANTLLAMYANDGYTWDDTEGLDMTGSSKQLKSKTVGGELFYTDMFEGYMTGISEASALTVEGQTDGGLGQAGVVLSTTNPAKQYLQDAQGQEWTQLIEKGLMGACFAYNISSVYLASGKMDVDNTTPEDPANGKYYTKMEHHWDEAYGYFTDAVDYPTNGTNRFWGKYANSRETLLGSATKIGEAFRLGRAAISNDVMAVRDAQIAVINAELERLAAGTAIHYLNDAVSDFGDDALRNHELSEAKAFIQALQFIAGTSVPTAEVEHLLEDLGEDYYNVTTATIIEVRDELAALTGLTDKADQL